MSNAHVYIIMFWERNTVRYAMEYGNSIFIKFALFQRMLTSLFPTRLPRITSNKSWWLRFAAAVLERGRINTNMRLGPLSAEKCWLGFVLGNWYYFSKQLGQQVSKKKDPTIQYFRFIVWLRAWRRRIRIRRLIIIAIFKMYLKDFHLCLGL